MPLNDDVLMGIVAELDAETFGHCKRVQTLALTLGRRMGLTSPELSQLSQGALLHDVGKKFIPPEILNKSTPLTPEEWAVIQTHPRLGFECVASLGLDDIVQGIILGHHRWANGQGGYPQEAGHTKPCLLTQITTVADVVDAMTSHRPYREALSISSCLVYLQENAGTIFNRDIVTIFKASLRQTRRALS